MAELRKRLGIGPELMQRHPVSNLHTLGGSSCAPRQLKAEQSIRTRTAWWDRRMPGLVHRHRHLAG